MCYNNENNEEEGRAEPITPSPLLEERIQMILIAGQIEGHTALPPAAKATKYEHIIPLLAAIEASSKIDGLLILLNTVGGDVEAGLALAEMIAGMTKPTVSLVMGGGHSIGIPLAVSAKRSFIVPSATMTVHPVRFNGLVIGVPQSFTYLGKMQDRITDFIVKHSNITKEDLCHLMFDTDELASDIGSLIEGEEAVRYGLIDKIGSIGEAYAAIREMCKQ